jgi:dihydrodipicolinate reductase
MFIRSPEREFHFLKLMGKGSFMEHILITGASGYFGQRLVRLFEEKPEVKRITGIDTGLHNPFQKSTGS